MIRPHTYSYVVSTAALVVALSGGAYATGLIGTSQIRVNDLGKTDTVSLQSAVATYALIPAG